MSTNSKHDNYRLIVPVFNETRIDNFIYTSHISVTKTWASKHLECIPIPFLQTQEFIELAASSRIYLHYPVNANSAEFDREKREKIRDELTICKMSRYLDKLVAELSAKHIHNI